MTGQAQEKQKGQVPGWVPQAAMHYLRHTEQGLSIREVARAEGCRASTILRRIRRFEQRRDDPLVDEALAHLGKVHFRTCDNNSSGPEETAPMTAHFAPVDMPSRRLCDEATVNREARRVLRRLAESGAVLAVATDMEKAAVLREMPDGSTNRTAVVDRNVAHAFVLKEWIVCKSAGRIASYSITAAGRSALKRLLSEDRAAAGGFAEAPMPFGDQHREWGHKVVLEDTDSAKPRRVRYNMAESPVVALSRRREKDGTTFLDPELVVAAERLREDFELAQMGPRVTQNWERFLTAGTRGGFHAGDPVSGPEGARDRVAKALEELGPGLGDMVLRCCCYLEGLEATERRLGWSARSGKIVLRIALQRLARHYEEEYGPGRGMIG
ncbi:DUF6456 domain-containing protein [Aliiruegeria sabulilitoris]|uniref:DUF6456 domain-containing protein n=1 Tax=Aliiruegeria sabulilitoris TaxID=1510458 RepID=UPI00082BB360|nr:DUF6456 domain-containing protein [Aliiruegeria sabulilitoris]NDR58279.1 helix-turn-helix domain-containing protein [Pseudoruegeria sp. M32A2M]